MEKVGTGSSAGFHAQFSDFGAPEFTGIRRKVSRGRGMRVGDLAFRFSS